MVDPFNLDSFEERRRCFSAAFAPYRPSVTTAEPTTRIKYEQILCELTVERDRLYIKFRGTQPLENWFTNLNALQDPISRLLVHADMAEGVKVMMSCMNRNVMI